MAPLQARQSGNSSGATSPLRPSLFTLGFRLPWLGGHRLQSQGQVKLSHLGGKDMCPRPLAATALKPPTLSHLRLLFPPWGLPAPQPPARLLPSLLPDWKSLPGPD